MSDTVTVELLAEVKNHLNITWDDEATDNKVRSLILSAMAYLDLKSGAKLDYRVSGMPLTLLKEYVRYARDEALDVFENNYLELILAMRNSEQVKSHVESSKQT